MPLAVGPRAYAAPLLRLLDPHVSRRSPRARAGFLFGAGAVAGSAFGAVAAASARRATVATDERVHARMVDRLDGAAGDAAAAVAPTVDQAGKWRVYAPVALAAAGVVAAAPARGPRSVSRRGPRRAPRARWAGAAAIAVVPALATALSPAFDRWLPQPPVGSRRRPLDHPVFPSGHAFRAAAVALTAAYVVAREGLARPGAVWPLAVAAPAAVGLARLVREKHHASDVVGGWLAGAALAAATAGAYELARAPRRRR